MRTLTKTMKPSTFLSPTLLRWNALILKACSSPSKTRTTLSSLQFMPVHLWKMIKSGVCGSSSPSLSDCFHLSLTARYCACFIAKPLWLLFFESLLVSFLHWDLFRHFATFNFNFSYFVLIILAWFTLRNCFRLFWDLGIEWCDRWLQPWVTGPLHEVSQAWEW